jgi:REP element-mobilizing transposase RayT
MYNPEIHHRRSIRLRDYDYSSEGAYFITICTRNKECLFNTYPSLKEIVYNQWHEIPNRYPNIELDEYIIMPNHIHGIVINVGAGFTPAPQRATARVAPTPIPHHKTIGTIIGEFKSLCILQWIKYIEENNINEIGKFWQRNYYEHIIRNEFELEKIRKYIFENPLKWEDDEYYNVGAGLAPVPLG